MSAPTRPAGADPMQDAFDRALGSAARSLAVEPLPGDILAAPGPVGAHSRLRSEVPLAAAVAIVVLAIGSAIGAPKAPVADPAPAFRTGEGLSVELRTSGFSCRPGTATPAGRPRMEAIVCTATTPSVLATVVVSEDPAGHVGEIHVDSDILGTPSATSDRDRADLLVATIGQSFADPADAAAARAWLTGELPLDPAEQVRTTIHAVPIVVARGLSSYSMVLGNLGAESPVLSSR